MDKNKSEKLKEILNQTISKDEIKQKLEKEIEETVIKKVAKKKEDIKKEANKVKKTKNIEIKIIEEEIKKEDTPKQSKEPKKEEEKEIKKNKKDLIIPTVRDKKKKNRDINILLYLVGAIALLLFLVVVYLFMSKDENTKKISNQQTITTEKFYKDKESTTLYIKNSPIEEIKKEIKDNINTDEAKKGIEDINTDEIKKVVKNINTDEIKKVVENINTDEIEKVIEEEKVIQIKEVIKEKIITKVIKLDKTNFKEYYNSTKYNTLKCYNFKAGDIFPNSKCKKDLKEFLRSNKNAIRFEVIPVIAQDDDLIFAKMQNNIKNMNKDYQNRVKEYMFRGLGRERVLETSWQIKDILGEDTVLTPTNYYVNSKKNNKGIIIKAYH